MAFLPLYVLAFMRLPSDHTTDSLILVYSVYYIKIHIFLASYCPLPISLFRREHLPEMDGAMALGVPVDILALQASSNSRPGVTLSTASYWWSPFVDAVPPPLPWIGPPDYGLADRIRRSTFYFLFRLPLGRRVFDVVRRYGLSALYVLAFIRLPSDHITDAPILV
jgi:hypothetical protein